MHKITIIPPILPVPVPDEFGVLAFANTNVLNPPTMLVDQTITLPPLVNLDVFEILVLTTVDPFDVPVINNVSTLNAPTVSVAPADGFIYPPSLANASTLNAPTVSVAPPDGTIALPSIANASTLEALEVDADIPELSEDHDAVVANQVVGTEPA